MLVWGLIFDRLLQQQTRHVQSCYMLCYDVMSLKTAESPFHSDKCNTIVCILTLQPSCHKASRHLEKCCSIRKDMYSQVVCFV